MKIKEIFELEFENIKAEKYDAVFAASGFEHRATHVAKNLTGTIDRKIVFAFSDRNELSRQENDKGFNELGYQSLAVSGDDAAEVKKTLSEMVRSSDKEKLNLLVDYSCMTRLWYASFLDFFKEEKRGTVAEINIYFAYSPAQFTEPPQVILPNEFMGPVPGFCNLRLPETRTALIIGLGYEPDRSLGLYEFLDPAETYAFYTEPSHDSKFTLAVKENNKELMRRLGDERLFAYPMQDLGTTSNLLTSLSLGLSKNYRVILAPLGPKPFSLLCFLLAIRFPFLDVWRVSPGRNARSCDRFEKDPPVVCKVTFELELNNAT